MENKVIETMEKVPDPRKGNAVRHILSDILMIGLLTIICNGNGFAAMYIFGVEHEQTLRKFLKLPYGIPSQDTFERVFAKLNPKTLSETFLQWVDEIKTSASQDNRLLVSIDGKTLRGSKTASKKAVHVVTAFASELRLVLCEVATDEKSNEITAIPKLLEMFCHKGMVTSIDAMGTQTDIAEIIVDAKADYVLSVKGNQKTLHEDVAILMEHEVVPTGKDALAADKHYFRTLEKGHGRIETRECYICPYVNWLSTTGDWKGLAGFGMIVSKREELGKVPTTNVEYFIYSLENASAEELLHIKRSHWAIENNLHWTLDVVSREDDSRARCDNSPEILNILRKQALQLMKDEDSFKASLLLSVTVALLT